MGGLWVPLLVYAALVVAALVGVEARKVVLFAISKPAATLSLLLIVGAPHGRFGTAVVVGILLAAVGDAILVSDKPAAFMGGLVLFLLAHVSYAVGFLDGLSPDACCSLPISGLLVVVVASAMLVRRLWSGVSAGLRIPLVLYAAAISVMVGTAFLTIGGAWPARVTTAAALGALVFYVSDVNLAWNQFARPYPHGRTVTLVTYWTGQLGVALAARWYGQG